MLLTRRHQRRSQHQALLILVYLRTAARDAARGGYAYVVVDGTLIAIDQVAADRPFYSGKHRGHGMNLQVIANPSGGILWVSGALPGSVHDKKAEWIWGVLDELQAAGLIVLADKGYQGAAHAKVPYKGRNKPRSQKDANKAHAQLRSPGERANAQLKTWRILCKLRCCPWRRPARQGYTRFADPRGKRRMKKVQCTHLPQRELFITVNTAATPSAEVPIWISILAGTGQAREYGGQPHAQVCS
jgi:hypothetical protein